MVSHQHEVEAEAAANRAMGLEGMDMMLTDTEVMVAYRLPAKMLGERDASMMSLVEKWGFAATGGGGGYDEWSGGAGAKGLRGGQSGDRTNRVDWERRFS